MKRLAIIAGSLALAVACAKTPEAQTTTPGNALASPAPANDARPVATSGPAAAATPATPPGAMPSNAVKKAFGDASSYREVTLPAGTVLPVDLQTAVGSDTSRVEQPVQGRLRRAVTVQGVQVLPAGTTVSGHVTAAQRPGKVKGRGMIAMRFTQLDTPGEGRTAISTATVSRIAPATKEKDALKIVAPATAGAVIGRIAGGKGAAAKGAVIGGGAGAGYVLATRGKDVRLAPGAPLSVRLTAPVTIRVPVR
jgi:hypothetical protein